MNITVLSLTIIPSIIPGLEASTGFHDSLRWQNILRHPTVHKLSTRKNRLQKPPMKMPKMPWTRSSQRCIKCIGRACQGRRLFWLKTPKLQKPKEYHLQKCLWLHHVQSADEMFVQAELQGNATKTPSVVEVEETSAWGGSVGQGLYLDSMQEC